MADVDLIPADYLSGQLVRLRAKQLLIACIAVAAVVGAARAALGVAMSVEKMGIARLQKDGEALERIKKQADAYRQQKLLAEKQLAELDELRGGGKVGLLLQAIDAAYDSGVWLDEMRFLRRDRAVVASATPLPAGGRSEIIVIPVPAPGAAQPADSGEQRVELIGHAANHTRLAEFMRNLGAQPGVAEVRLQDSALGASTGAPAIDVSLVLLLDNKTGGRQ
jgi:Tfp pilus assembly protein PilN